MAVFVVPPIEGIKGAGLGEFHCPLGRAASGSADVGCVRGDDLGGYGMHVFHRIDVSGWNLRMSYMNKSLSSCSLK